MERRKTKTTAHERKQAREKLIQRNIWTPRMEEVFIGKALQLD